MKRKWNIVKYNETVDTQTVVILKTNIRSDVYRGEHSEKRFKETTRRM